MKNNVKKLERIIVAIVWAIIVCTFAFFRLTKLQPTKIGYECYIKKYAHFSCPACGITRAIECILRLDFVSAFKFNPLFMVLLVYIFLNLAYYTINCFTKKPPIKRKELSVAGGITLCIVIVAFVIVRNTPFYLQFFYV